MKQTENSFSPRLQSLAEEITNAISHGFGLLAAVVISPFLISQAMTHSSTAAVVGVSVFCVTTVLTYAASMLYHSLAFTRAKYVFQIIDHCGIFLLIAGTYTPFSLAAMEPLPGWTLFSVIWSCAIAGIFLKGFLGTRGMGFSTFFYVLMGWMAIFFIKPLFRSLPDEAIWWLVAGGIFYTGGVVFFVTDEKRKFHHSIWHLFVFAGTVCHGFAIYNWLLPRD